MYTTHILAENLKSRDIIKITPEMGVKVPQKGSFKRVYAHIPYQFNRHGKDVKQVYLLVNTDRKLSTVVLKATDRVVVKRPDAYRGRPKAKKTCLPPTQPTPTVEGLVQKSMF